jgi:flagellin
MEGIMTSILTNVAAMSASRQLNITNHSMQQTIERLTTGKRINRASDDAAGLAQAVQFDAGARIANENIKLANTAYFAAQASDGYLSEATNQVQRLVELYAGGNGASPEVTSVLANANAAMQKAGQSDLTITDLTTAQDALDTITTARGTFAATMATQSSLANLSGIEKENDTAALGNIMDINVGDEIVNLTKFQVLAQSGTNALMQANQASQYVLSLLR